MEPEAPEVDLDPPVGQARARRARGLIAVSLLVIVLTGVAYLHPSLGPGMAPTQTRTASFPASYQLAAVDFVTPATGWFAATFDSGRFALMHTTDSGDHWTNQLAGDIGRAGVYVNFFDSTHGVVAVLGAQSVIYRTGDGGRTWSVQPILSGVAYLSSVSSVSFADAVHGWL